MGWGCFRIGIPSMERAPPAALFERPLLVPTSASERREASAVNVSLILFAEMTLLAASVSRGLAAAVVLSALPETSAWRYA